jgi:hypothetical protein
MAETLFAEEGINMGDMNYGEVVDGADIPASLERGDWTKRYHVLSVEASTRIPGMMEVEMWDTVPGEEVKARISRVGTDCLEAINWGNGYRGLCVHDSQYLHYILRSER